MLWFAGICGDLCPETRFGNPTFLLNRDSSVGGDLVGGAKEGRGAECFLSCLQLCPAQPACQGMWSKQDKSQTPTILLPNLFYTFLREGFPGPLLNILASGHSGKSLENICCKLWDSLNKHRPFQSSQDTSSESRVWVPHAHPAEAQVERPQLPLLTAGVWVRCLTSVLLFPLSKCR